MCTAVKLLGHEWKGMDMKMYCDALEIVEMLMTRCCNFRREDLMESPRIIGAKAFKHNFYSELYTLMALMKS